MSSYLSRGGQWFLQSGIQDSGGGVARFYRTDQERNNPVSTEITGYAVSLLVWLNSVTGEEIYLDRALSACRFLVRSAWDGQTMPFEIEPGPDGRFAYFFDCGVIVRGLLSMWRATSCQEFLKAAAALGRGMQADFAASEGQYHPILQLPDKQPLPYDPLRWSRAPGCYQLKAALGWWDLYEATGESLFCDLYEQAVAFSLRQYVAFLPGHTEKSKIVDRLHAFLYFLEGLLPRAQDQRCAAALQQGVQQVSRIVSESAADFERSDVYAQLLRIRLYADWNGAVPLDICAAHREAGILAGFQASSTDPRIDCGFYFGRVRDTWLPYVNPVSTAFALQALALWDQHQAGGPPARPNQLI